MSATRCRSRSADAGTDTASLILSGQTLVAIHDAAFLLGPSFCAGIGNGLLLGSLLYGSGLLPRRFAMLGIVGRSMAFIAAAGALFDVYDQNSGAQFLLTIPEIIWEASLAVYLIRRGFRSEGLARLGKPAVAGVTGTPAIAPT